MQAELESKSLELLNWLETAVKATADFSAREVPIFIQELLRYNFCMSLIWFIFGVVGLIVTIFGFYKTFLFLKKEDMFEFSPFLTCFAVPFFIFGAIAKDNMDWIKIKLAPRVYLLDYARETFKK